MLKYILIGIGSIALFLIAIIIFIHVIFYIIFGKSYNMKDLINNYENNTQEIVQLIEYYSSIVPDNFRVSIEFNSVNSINLRVWELSDDPNTQNTLWFQEWNINPYNYIEKPQSEYEKKYGGKTKSLSLIKDKLGWSDHTFREIKVYLDKADCISISNGDVFRIGFQRSGMSKYYYLVFEDNLDKELQQEYSNNCNLLFYKDNIVFYYGIGAIGRECTPEFRIKDN